MLKKSIIYFICGAFMLNFTLIPVKCNEQQESDATGDSKVWELIENSITKMTDEPLRTEEYYYYAELVGTEITDWSPFYLVDGQDPGGHRFDTPGSGIYWYDSGGISGTWTTSVVINYSIVNVTISVEGASSGTYSGYLEAVPTDMLGKFVLLYIRRNYRVKKYNIYRYRVDESPSQAILFSTYTTTEKYSSDCEYRLA